jgi:hypothetical protein
MRKDTLLGHENSCFRKMLDTEEGFLLLGRDLVAPNIIASWCQLRIANRLNTRGDVQIQEAYECAAQMLVDYQRIRSTLDAIRSPRSR